MSKNFELLSRAGWRQDYFEGLPKLPTPPPEPEPRDRTPPRKMRTSVPDGALSSLVRKVFLEPQGGQPRIVTFTGAARRAGCTWTCVHAAKTLAECVDGKVCIVDANFEAPSIQQYFPGCSPSGFSDALLDGQSSTRLAVRAGEANLWCLPSGNSCKRITLFPESSRVASAVRDLSKEFDYVLMDAPALTSGGLAVEICKAGNGAVLVLEPSGVTATVLARGRALLAAARVQLFGVVLNQRELTLPPMLDRLIR